MEYSLGHFKVYSIWGKLELGRWENASRLKIGNNEVSTNVSLPLDYAWIIEARIVREHPYNAQ